MMKKQCLIVLSLLLHLPSLMAQHKLPIIKATDKSVAIRDGNFIDKNAWTLSPEIKLDVYTADRTRKPKWVVFYTDIDSIRVKVKPGTKFDFIILLNGRDTCYTQIASAIPLENNSNSARNTHDTIPFMLTSFNAIHVKATINDRDTVNLHFDVGSFDFRLTQEAILNKTNLLSNQPDALSGKIKPNYRNLEKVSKIQMGSLSWDNPEFKSTLLTAHDMDGRFGWNIFEGMVVEIDYDKSLIIVHSKLPKKAKRYSKSRIEFIRSFVCVKGAIKIKNKKYTGSFLLDTGSDKAMIIDSAWAKKQNLPTDLTFLKSSSFRDPRGVKFDNKIVLCPSFGIQGHSLHDIPMTLLGGKNPANIEVNLLGNDLLKRFNTLLDFKNDRIYLKPNGLTNLPYKDGV